MLKAVSCLLAGLIFSWLVVTAISAVISLAVCIGFICICYRLVVG